MKTVVKALAATGAVVVVANVVPLVVVHHTEKDKTEKAYEDRIKDQSSRSVI